MSNDIDGRLYRRIAFRLLPILGIGYLIAYVDRVNVGFAKLQMSADIGLSAAAYGLGAGIFFLAYCLLEIPSNLVLERVGARVWLCRIMVTWGMVTILTGFVQTPGQFYLARIALGAAEAGFFPGVMFFLATWFPKPRLGRATAVVVMAGSLAGVLVGPFSGFVMGHFDGLSGLAGWQWLFVVAGVPAVLLGFVMLFLLPNTPVDARWLSADDRHVLVTAIAAGTSPASERTSGVLTGAGEAMRNLGVWGLGFCMAATYLTIYAVAFWLPTIIQLTGTSDLGAIGWISAIPGVVATISVLVFGGFSDRTGSYSGVVIITLLAAAGGLVLTVALSTAFAPTVIGLSVANAMAFAAVPAIWWLVHDHLGRGAGAAAGVALVNTIASFGSFLGPYIIGLGQDWTGSFRAPMYVIASVAVAAAAVIGLGCTRRRREVAARSRLADEAVR